MAGIYIHIPFCRQACHYCDFHFSTSAAGIPAVMQAIRKEIRERAPELAGQEVETIYFGGGTPSLVAADYIREILGTVFSCFRMGGNPEITLEANPDDLDTAKLRDLKNTAVNRFSIGVQSFSDSDLQYMNRAHTAAQADYCIKAAQDIGFGNISIDLIYGTPGMQDAQWRQNLEKAVELQVSHISSYALTVEKNTPLFHLIRRKMLPAVREEDMERQFGILADYLPGSGFEHYEISSFARPGMRSRHNSSYWEGKPYLGIGPAAHSFDGHKKRRWNVASNISYTRQADAGERYWEEEILEDKDRVNEYIMTRLRTSDGLDLSQAGLVFGNEAADHIRSALQQVDSRLYELSGDTLRLTRAGKLFADRMAAELFITG